MIPTKLFYSPRLLEYDYGPSHPMRIERLGLTLEIMRQTELLDRPGIVLVEPPEAPPEAIESFHHPEYLEILRGIDQGRNPAGLALYGLGYGDNPVIRGVYSMSALIAGGSIAAAEAVVKGEVPVAFNITGGLHHAMANRASGFCYINDPVVAIHHLLKHKRKVLYLDIDVHHGDGVQRAFYEDDRVMTVSIHETGETLFPGTGYVEESGSGPGAGHSVNVPLYPHTDDETYLWVFDRVLPPLITSFRPDVIVTQLGVDTFIEDPLAHLLLTSHGFLQVLDRIKSWKLPWVALGGGGYKVANVARAWTLALAKMANLELPAQLSHTTRNLLKSHGWTRPTLEDAEPTRCEDQTARKYAERSVIEVEKHVFSLLGI
ncbi:MAG: acetoin utilization protein AcuC [Acidobacteria bacterium]|nr:acetoin utilization protein AcuC [Acidobacteriota bacterium]